MMYLRQVYKQVCGENMAYNPEVHLSHNNSTYLNKNLTLFCFRIAYLDTS